jgi:hypothetical protein
MDDLKLIYKEILLYQNGDICHVDFWDNINKIQTNSTTLNNIDIKL